jgi:exodeoxyribonuclease V alpha subunit
VTTTTAPTTPAPSSGREDGDTADVLRVADCPPVLAPFNLAGVLHPADVHTAVALCRMTGADADPTVLLATALAVRGPRVGHVCVDLATVHETVSDVEDDAASLRALPWPDDVDTWVTAVRDAQDLVWTADGQPGDCGDVPCPLTLHGTRLYLDRYWRYEGRTAAQLTARARVGVPGVDLAELRRGLDELFGEPSAAGPDLQRLAAATAVTRQLAVIAGGPGTGKTTTVARVLALLDAQATATGRPQPRVALVAPTGKAAARLEESLREALDRDPIGDDVRERLSTTEASTIHRLLRRRPDNESRFRHDARDPLPHDVVIVDEASMVSLSLVAKLLDALSEHTRLVLVGDPQQLRSVEAGAVLGDIVGPALLGPRMSPDVRRSLTAVTGEEVAGLSDATTDPGIGDGIVVLQRVHRFDETSGIADLATAIQAGDVDRVLEVLRSGRTDVTFVERADDADDDGTTPLDGVREAVVATGHEVARAAAAGDASAALAAIEQVRVLCAHRRGPFGVATWIPRIEDWLGTRPTRAGDGWEVGRPVLVTRNDHQLRIYNGDVGVVVATGDGPRVAFPTASGPRLLPPSRLTDTETVHAMTIHKSQGSQFRHAVVVLPAPDSRILSRELFYTGVTRAQRQVTVVGSPAAVRTAVERVVRRASGLRDRLWGPAGS